MSGSKTFALTTGAAPVGGIGVAIIGAVVAVGAVATVAAVRLGQKAYSNYQERQKREQEAAKQKELEIKRRIAEIKHSNSDVSKAKVKVVVPKNTVNNSKQTKSAQIADRERKIANFKSRLPEISQEYQTLVEQQLLDNTIIFQALEQATQALNENNLEKAEAYVQALDNARIQVIQKSRQERNAQVDYLSERFSQMRDRIPSTFQENLSTRIEQLKTKEFSDSDLEQLHNEISELTAQADRIEEAAQNLVNSWQTVGYVAQIISRDDGDMVIEVETHEGVNTQMRIQFDGQEINLFGPKEESHSCASRTIEAMRTFQEQGYQLEWTHLDNEPVSEEWRHLYSTDEQEVMTVETEAETVTEAQSNDKSQRRQQAQRG